MTTRVTIIKKLFSSIKIKNFLKKRNKLSINLYDDKESNYTYMHYFLIK